MGDKSVTIEPSALGPIIVKGRESLRNSKGEELSTKNLIALCRCGGSTDKPLDPVERGVAHQKTSRTVTEHTETLVLPTIPDPTLSPQET